jgi:general secretion pathway protein C
MKFDIHYLFTTKYAKWIIVCFISLFSLLIIIEYASLYFPLSKPSAAPISAASLPTQGKQDSLEYILNAQIFGEYVPENLNEDNVKKSVLNVAIVGVLLGDNPDESQVIIRAADGEEKTYKVADKISGEAVIKRIMADGILVERNGALESLSLPKNDLIFEPVPKPLSEE